MDGDWIQRKKILNGSDYIHSLGPPVDTDSQAKGALVIDKTQKLQPAAFHGLSKDLIKSLSKDLSKGLIKLKVNCPYVM